MKIQGSRADRRLSVGSRSFMSRRVISDAGAGQATALSRANLTDYNALGNTRPDRPWSPPRAAQSNPSDPERHRVGRLQLLDARAVIVTDAFASLARAGHSLPGEIVIGGMAARYNSLREEQMYLFDGAHHVVDTFRAKGVRLALITNGAAAPQRAKVVRFDLTHRFHHIQIEGEHGFGKPEERAYRHALGALGVEAHETWMVGDNLEWEVIAPQRLGIHAIWHDPAAQGVPDGSTARPDRVIRSLHELLHGIG
jgi:putative hydrolase of the HAD superfamily